VTVYAEQQRYWVALLNLHRTWTSDEAALTFLPPRHRDFTSSPEWPQAKAITFLLNNLELIRESHRRLEAGDALDWDLLNHGLAGLTLRLHPWESVSAWREAHRARADLGSRLETLQVTSGASAATATTNPGTRYVRATVERSLYYFAQYVDDRLADPAYPGVSPGRWRVAVREDGSGDLALMSAQPTRASK
jgi:hypothetical protein